MSDSTRKTPTRKSSRKHFVPPKPKKFPLTPHAGGKWMKKINGKLHYFGAWARRENGELVRIEGDGRDEALQAYKFYLLERSSGGQSIKNNTDDGLTVKELCNRFYTSKARKLESNELSPRTLNEYGEAVKLVASSFGSPTLVEDLGPENFEKLRAVMAKKWGPARVGKFVGIVRSIFKYATENGLIDKPIVFGSEFKKPDKRTIKKLKNDKGKKLFTAQELRDLLNGKTIEVAGKKVEVPGATPPMRAMILLGINAGLGNTDIGNLETRHIDLESGWLDYPRPKTEEQRRAPLWPETIKALKVAIADRAKAKDKADADCVFINRGGRRMVQTNVTQNEDATEAKLWSQDYVSTAFGKLLQSMKINGRKGLNFYSLRHTFATIGLQTGDRDAVKALMGHASHDILSVYDETGPDDDRLNRVVSHVHAWLFGKGGVK